MQQNMPDFCLKYAQSSGYQTVHIQYKEMQKYFQHQVYRSHGAELMAVNVTLIVQELGKKKEVMVSVSFMVHIHQFAFYHHSVRTSQNQ